jgi:hypothetical protein
MHYINVLKLLCRKPSTFFSIVMKLPQLTIGFGVVFTHLLLMALKDAIVVIFRKGDCWK